MQINLKTYKANFVDCYQRSIYPVEITISEGRIKSIEPIDEVVENFLIPGWVDAHIHIESSMLVPTEFAKIAVLHGTVATVSDPHEIANVLGTEGVEFMIENAAQTSFKFNFGVPSCVPATTFESAGASIELEDAEHLFQNYPEIKYLSEVMNYPGVIHGDQKMLDLIALAKRMGKQVDGHAPGLRGEDLQRYMDAGISTDHECFTYEEGLEKLEKGLKVIIREGSAAKNFDALIPLLKLFPERIMFCSDDKHPDDLLEGHVNQLVARAVGSGYDLFDVVKAASINAVEHYGLEVGLLREGDYADFQIVEDLENFKPLLVSINGEIVMQNETSYLESVPIEIINNFNRNPIKISDIRTPIGTEFRTIVALDGQLITEEGRYNTHKDSDNIPLKIVNINRYWDSPPAKAFVENFNLKNCAIASSVAHDSHNILVVGSSDELIVKAANLIIANRGGIAFVSENAEQILPLPIAGIMSDKDCKEVGRHYKELDKLAKEHGCSLSAPYMTLSFLALLVIPQLKLSDLGLFDGEEFRFSDLVVR